MELYYESLGEGVPLMLQAHDHSPWVTFQGAYFAQWYRFVTFDRRGTGRSADPPGPWSVPDFARDLRNLMDALGIESAIVGGSSLGGVITAQFALDYPERARALVIGHTVPYPWDLAREWLDGLVAAAREGRAGDQLQPRSYAWEESGPPSTDPTFAASEIGRLAASVGTRLGRDGEAMAKMFEAMRTWDQRPRYEELRRLRVPTLFIAGARDAQKTIELMHEWHQQVPDSEFLILRDAHHAAQRERALEWNVTVRGFLRRHGL